MKKFFTGPSALRNYLVNGGEEVTCRPYARDAKSKQDFIDCMSRDGFEGPQFWYIATKDNHHIQADRKLPERVDKVDVQVLYIGCKDDAVCRVEAMHGFIQAGLLPKLEQAETIDAAHWVTYEQPGRWSNVSRIGRRGTMHRNSVILRDVYRYSSFIISFKQHCTVLHLWHRSLAGHN